MDHIQRKFPERVEEIRALVQKNPDFSELCNDYEEMCTWLATQTLSYGGSDEELDLARELMQDLEEDIFQQLEQER